MKTVSNQQINNSLDNVSHSRSTRKATKVCTKETPAPKLNGTKTGWSRIEELIVREADQLMQVKWKIYDEQKESMDRLAHVFKINRFKGSPLGNRNGRWFEVNVDRFVRKLSELRARKAKWEESQIRKRIRWLEILEGRRTEGVDVVPAEMFLTDGSLWENWFRSDDIQLALKLQSQKGYATFISDPNDPYKGKRRLIAQLRRQAQEGWERIESRLERGRHHSASMNK